MKALRFSAVLLLLNLLLLKSAYSKNVYSAKRNSPPQYQTIQIQVPPLTPPVTPPTNSLAVTKTSLDDVSPARLRFAPTLGLQNGTLGYGGTGEFIFSTGVPFYMGVEAGYLRFQTDESQLEIVPVLFTMVYRFNLQRGSVHPYLGAAVGVSFAGGSLSKDGKIVPVDGTRTDLMALGRPGVEFDLSKTTSFFLEPQVGILQSQFAFVPQAGFAFSF